MMVATNGIKIFIMPLIYWIEHALQKGNSILEYGVLVLSVNILCKVTTVGVYLYLRDFFSDFVSILIIQYVNIRMLIISF